MTGRKTFQRVVNQPVAKPYLKEVTLLVKVKTLSRYSNTFIELEAKNAIAARSQLVPLEVTVLRVIEHEQPTEPKTGPKQEQDSV